MNVFVPQIHMWNRTPQVVERRVLGLATPDRDWYPHERQPFRHGDTRNLGREGGPCLAVLAPRPTPAPRTSSCMSRQAWHSATAAPGRQLHPSQRGPRADPGRARLSRSPPAGGLWAPLTTLSWVSGPLTCRREIYQASITTRATSLKQILSTHPVLFLRRAPSSSTSVNLLLLVDRRAAWALTSQLPCPGAHLARSVMKLKAWQPQEHGGDRDRSIQAQRRPSWEAELWIRAPRRNPCSWLQLLGQGVAMAVP